MNMKRTNLLDVNEFLGLFLFTNKYKIFSWGSQYSKTQHLKVLLVLIRSKSGIPINKLIEYKDDPEMLDKKCKYFFRNINTKKGIERLNIILKNPLFETQRNKTIDVVNEIFTNTKDDLSYEFYLTTDFKDQDFLKQSYLVGNVDEIYAYDTTEIDNVYVTPLMDLGSRLVVSLVITNKPPTSKDIIELFEKIFLYKDEEEKEKIQVIHADLAGPNTDKDVINYCQKKGIKLSYPHSRFKFANQILENWNKTLKGLVVRARFGVDTSITFEEFVFAEQVKIIKFVVEFYNMQESKSQALPKGSTPITLHRAKTALRCLGLLIGAPKTPKGIFITKYSEMVFARYKLLKSQENAANQNKNIPLLKILKTKAIISYKKRIKYGITKIVKTTEKLNNLTDLYNKMIEISSEDPLGIQKLLKIVSENQELFSKKALVSINISPRNAKYQNEKIDSILEENKKIKSALSKTILLLKDTTERVKILENSQLEKEKIILLKHEKQFKIKLSKNKKIKGKYAIYPEHFKFILNNIVGRRYQRSRARVAHTLLRIFGFRISNLKTITSEQLSNLKNKQTFKILVTGSKLREEVFLVFPYVSEMKKFIDPILPDIEILQEVAEINKLKYNLEPNESEFWSTKIITRVQLTNSINKQLKLACAKYNAKFTSHSYRRGIATVVAHMSGYEAANKYLNHSNINTTQRNISIIQNDVKETDNKVEKIKSALKKALRVENSIDMPKLSKDNQTLKETETAVNSLLNKERAENLESSDSDID